MEAALKNFKQVLQENDRNVDIQGNPESYFLIIDDWENEIKILIERNHLNTEIELQYFEGEKGLNEKESEALFSFLEEESKSKHQYLWIEMEKMTPAFDFPFKQWLEKKGYVKIPKQDEIDIKADYIPPSEHGMWMEEISLKRLKQYCSLINIAEKCLNKFKEKEYLFDFDWSNNGYDFNFYYQGVNGYINIHFEHEKDAIFIIYNEENEIAKKENLSTEEDVNQFFLTYFHSIEQKQRIKGIFEEYRHFFTFYIEDYCMEREMQNKIYTLLRAHYKAIEIEEISSKMSRKGENLAEISKYQLVIEFGEKMIFVDDEHDEILLVDKNKEGKEQIKHFILNKMEKEIEKNVKKLIE